jgi:hypothetical protein
MEKIHLPVSIIDGDKCSGRGGCQQLATTEPHRCPYAAEINDNHDDEFCTCCDDCTHECAMDI